jgi:hypothetical protein
MKIYIAQHGQKLGPCSLEDVNNYLSDGTFSLSDLAWYEGLDAWIPITSVPGILIPSAPEPQPPPLPVWSSPAAPKLWNPNAAANWSLLFTPVFGAWLHAKNWSELGQSDRHKKSMSWVYISIVLAIAVLFFLDNAQLISIIYLFVWYFASGRGQVKYLKENNINYEKKSWGKVILYGIVGLIIYYVIAFGIISATNPSALLPDSPDSPDSPESQESL